MHEDGAVGLDDEQPEGGREVGGEPAVVVDAAPRDNKAHATHCSAIWRVRGADTLDACDRAEEATAQGRHAPSAAWPGASRGVAGWRLGGAPGTRRGRGQGVPLPRLRPGGLPGYRARGGLADARGRRIAAALAYGVLA